MSDEKYCFFCRALLGEHYDEHHLVPRSFSKGLIDEPENKVKTHRTCHTVFHDLPNSKKRNQWWYPLWLERIKAVSEQYYKIVVHKTDGYDIINKEDDGKPY